MGDDEMCEGCVLLSQCPTLGQYYKGYGDKSDDILCALQMS